MVIILRPLLTKPWQTSFGLRPFGRQSYYMEFATLGSINNNLV